MMNSLVERIKDLKLKFYLARQRFYRLFWTKKHFELEAQRKRAKDMASPGVKEKVAEYYYKFRFLQEIIDGAGINEDSKILDIGCGIKTVLHFLPGKLKIGVDSLADGYKKIYNYPKDIVIEKSFGEKLKYQDNFFDVVFVTNALDHMNYPEKVISEIYRALKRGGYLVLTNEIVEKQTKKDRAHPYNLGENDISNLLSSKFKIVFKKYSPWIGIRQYYLGIANQKDFNGNNKQITILAQKL